MAQKYYPIDLEETVSDAFPHIYENLASIISNFSGAIFPTNNLFVGMTCYRTDLKKTYRYNGVVWAVDIPEIATNEEALTGLDDSKMTTPKKVKQVVEDNKLLIATTEEALDGENNKKVMTSKTVKEVVEANKLKIATSEEMIIATNDEKFVTAKKVREKIDSNIYSMPIGNIYYAIRTDIPEGSVRLDGSEYTKELFPDFYADLASGKYPSVSYEQYNKQTTDNNGTCLVFGLDNTNNKFKVPVIKSEMVIASSKSSASAVIEKYILYPIFMVLFNKKTTSNELEYNKYISELENRVSLDQFLIKLKAKANTDMSNITSSISAVNAQYFTTAGTYYFSVPKGVEKIRVTCVGGAGGGGGGGGGADYVYGGNGACGYYNQKVLSVTPESIHTVTVGAGGGGGGRGVIFQSPTGGGSGGTTSFGNLLSASGGGGGGAGNGVSAKATFGGRYGLFQEYSIGGAGGVNSAGGAGTAGAVIIEW